MHMDNSIYWSTVLTKIKNTQINILYSSKFQYAKHEENKLYSHYIDIISKYLQLFSDLWDWSDLYERQQALFLSSYFLTQDQSIVSLFSLMESFVFPWIAFQWSYSSHLLFFVFLDKTGGH